MCRQFVRSPLRQSIPRAIERQAIGNCRTSPLSLINPYVYARLPTVRTLAPLDYTSVKRREMRVCIYIYTRRFMAAK